MPNIFSSNQIEKVLFLLGFSFISQNGSHAKYKNKEGNVVILPANKKVIPEGTFRSICKQANISVKEFNKLNDK